MEGKAAAGQASSSSKSGGRSVAKAAQASSSSSCGSVARTVTLRSSEGELFVVEEVVARRSTIVSNMMDDLGHDIEAIPLEVDSHFLASVMVYCKMLQDYEDDKETYERQGEFEEARARAEQYRNQHRDFLSAMDFEVLARHMVVADYLAIKDLLDDASREISERLGEMLPEQIRERFNIENDFDPEEEEKMRLEDPWVFYRTT